MEAAYALPRWLKPETASSRVWLFNKLLHIVPLPTATAPDMPSFPSLKQAKQIVQGGQINTVAGTCLLDSWYMMRCCTAGIRPWQSPLLSYQASARTEALQPASLPQEAQRPPLSALQFRRR